MNLNFILNILGSYWKVLRRKEICFDLYFKKMIVVVLRIMNFRG